MQNGLSPVGTAERTGFYSVVAMECKKHAALSASPSLKQWKPTHRINNALINLQAIFHRNIRTTWSVTQDDLIQYRRCVMLIFRGEVMLPLHPEYVVDEKQRRKAVLLSLAEWNRIIEDLEDLDDIRAFDAAKAGSQETIPFDQAVREIHGRQGKWHTQLKSCGLPRDNSPRLTNKPKNALSIRFARLQTTLVLWAARSFPDVQHGASALAITAWSTKFMIDNLSSLSSHWEIGKTYIDSFTPLIYKNDAGLAYFLKQIREGS
jgi:hypothetical protein